MESGVRLDVLVAGGRTSVARPDGMPGAG